MLCVDCGQQLQDLICSTHLMQKTAAHAMVVELRITISYCSVVSRKPSVLLQDFAT